MTNKIFIGDDEHRNEPARELRPPLTKREMESILSQMSIMTTLVVRSKDFEVRVHSGFGTTQYMAQGGMDFALLKNLSYKSEIRGGDTLYYIKMCS